MFLLSRPLGCVFPSFTLHIFDVMLKCYGEVIRYCGFLQVSAYASFGRMNGLGPTVEKRMRQMDPTTSEPQFTNCTRDFLGTLDYIFYTGETILFFLTCVVGSVVAFKLAITNICTNPVISVGVIATC